MTAKAVSSIWVWRFDHPPDRVWPLLADTARWNEAADLIISSLNTTLGQRRVTYDFERLMQDATLLKCSEFGRAMIENM